jgi:lipopolysaccharide transport system permease protein
MLPSFVGSKENRIDALVHSIRLGLFLGAQDIKQSYRRTNIGSYWLTIGIGIQVIAMSLVFSQIFGEDLKSYLPFITLGMIFWTYLSGSINDSSNALISADSILKQMPLDPSVFVIRNITKHTVVLGHNLIVIPILFIFLGTNFSITMLVFPIAIGLVILNLYWINLLVAITSARFRDFGPIVTSLMAVIFFVTPVLWRPNLLPPGTAHLLLGLNPLYHFLQLLRLPLSGELPTLENWLVSGVLAAVGIASASVMANKAKKSIASWL